MDTIAGQDWNLTTATNWTLIATHNISSAPASTVWFSGDDAAIITSRIALGHSGTENYMSSTGSGSWDILTPAVTPNVATSKPICFQLTFNGTHYNLYNDTHNTNTTSSTTKTGYWTQPSFFKWGTGYQTGTISQFILFKNRVLTSTERADWCANHTLIVGSSSNQAFAFNGSLSPSSSTKDTTFTINIEQGINITNNTGTCSLYLNQVLNETTAFSNLANTSSISILTYTKTVNLGYYNISINCTSNITNTSYIAGPNTNILRYQNPIAGNISISYTGALVQNNVTITCSYTDPYNQTTTTRYYVNNTYDNRLANTTSTIYTLNETDFQDKLDFYCEFCNWGNCTYTNQTSIPINTIDWQVYLWIFGFNNALLTSSYIEIQNTTVTEYGSPFNFMMSQILNQSIKSRNVSINHTDLNGYHVNEILNLNITETNNNYSINATPTRLVLYFYRNGVLTTASGFIQDLDKVKYFQNTSVVIYQQDLAMGRVIVKFGPANTSFTNLTQYYEYTNDGKVTIWQNLEVLSNPTAFSYIEVIDEATGLPIEGATVTAYNALTNSSSWLNYTTSNQRITDNVGMTGVFTDATTNKLMITKSGYTAVIVPTTLMDESYTKQSPYSVVLRKTYQSTIGGITYYSAVALNRTNSSIIVRAVSTTANTIEVNTDYRQLLGLGEKAMTEDTDLFYVVLNEGTDYDLASTTSITISVYVDGTYVGQFTINLAGDENQIMSYDPALIPYWVIGILIVIVTGAITMIFQNLNAGVAGFTIASIFASFINTAFLPLLTISLIYVVVKYLDKLVRE